MPGKEGSQGLPPPEGQLSCSRPVLNGAGTWAAGDKEGTARGHPGL